MKKIILCLLLCLGFNSSFEAANAADIQPSECIAYYGEISKRTGRPKTQYVRGYYRKDGTYVEGYYRSKPQK